MFRSFEARGMFGRTSRTVLYARELTSVYICYSQGGGFNIPLSRLLSESVRNVVFSAERPCMVMFGGTVMCYPGRR